MTTHTPSEPVTGRDVQDSPWANGLTIFAAAMMMIVGFWQALAGIAAIGQDKVYAATPEYIYAFDVTGWGWIHLLLGILIVCAGVAVFMGSTWARMLGIGAGKPEHDRELRVPPALPRLVAHDHRARRCRHLGPGHVPPGNLRSNEREP